MNRNGHAQDGIPLYVCERKSVDESGALSLCSNFKREEKQLKGVRYDVDVVARAHELYFGHNLTLRMIRHDLLMEFGVDIRPSTVLKWFQKYVPIVYDYILTLTPRVSDTWHMDEVDIRLRGGFERKKRGGQHGFGFGIRCPVTKFVHAFGTIMSEDAKDVSAVLLLARAMTKKTPAVIVSDDAGSFPAAIDLAFEDVSTKPLHVIARKGIGQRNGNQSSERLNNTFREWGKHRGFKSVDTPLLVGWMINYNFVRPHMELGDGLEDTPAHAAGLNIVSGKDKWLQLLTLALRISRDFLSNGVFAAPLLKTPQNPVVS